jgi:REP element-mobilizing transposase RayT
MHEWQSQSHVRWECKYHVVMIPKYRRLQFWSTGYCVSTIGLDEARVRQYIREQDELDHRQGELNLE